MASYVPNGRQQFCDQNGKPLALGTVGMYAVGTLTPANTWQDAAQTTLNTNPITLDAGGFASLYGSGSYRQIVKDYLGNVIWDRVATTGDGLQATAEQYGAVGDGSTNDGPAIQRGFDAGNKTIRLARFVDYCIATTVVVPQSGTVLLENGAVIVPGANTVLFDCSAPGATIQSIGSPGTIQGNGATYTTATAVKISGGYDQQVLNTNILDMGGACVEFNGADAGQRFIGDGGLWLRHDTTQPSVVKSGAIDVSAGNRTFTDVKASGGCLINLDGMENTGLVNCQMVNFLMGPNASRSRITGNRIANLGGTQVIDGYDNSFLGNVVAGNLQCATTSQRNIVGPDNVIAGGTISDLSNATGSNMNMIYDANGISFTPVWGQVSGTGPALGNGTLTGRLYRNGREYRVTIALSMGSTTTFGDNSADWTFSLPSPNNRTAAFAATGSATGVHSGTFQAGTARIAQGATVVTVRIPGGTTGWKQLAPVTWASGDTIELSISFEVG